MRATHLAVRMWSVHHRNAQSTNNFDKHNALMIFALFFTNADLGTARALAGARGVELHKTLYPFRLGRGFSPYALDQPGAKWKLSSAACTRVHDSTRSRWASSLPRGSLARGATAPVIGPLIGLAHASGVRPELPRRAGNACEVWGCRSLGLKTPISPGRLGTIARHASWAAPEITETAQAAPLAEPDEAPHKLDTRTGPPRSTGVR